MQIRFDLEEVSTSLHQLSYGTGKMDILLKYKDTFIGLITDYKTILYYTI